MVEPKISIAIPTLNNAKVLSDFFKQIISQDYPKDKVEIIVADGGSGDGTVEIAKRFGAKIYKNIKVLAEPGVDLAMNKATGDIIIVLAVDNLLYDKKSFRKYVKTFDNKDVYAAFPMHESRIWDSIYTKYVNRFTDPFSHFVYGYAANGRTLKLVYRTLETNRLYDIYDFKSSSDIPLIAFAQGFAIRGGYRRASGLMDDIKPVMDLIEAGKSIAFIHSLPLYHHSIKDLGHFIRKQRWGTRNAITKKNYGISHRFDNLSQSQKLRMRIWPMYALSFVMPFIYSIYHLFKDKEGMWIYHAPLCFISACSSVYEVLVYNISKREIVSRQ